MACDGENQVPVSVTRDNVNRYKVRLLHKGRSLAQADIYLLEIEGEPCVLKDFHDQSYLVRKLWGARIIAREKRVYRRLEGVRGIPRVLRMLDQYAFIMEYVKGERIPHRKDCYLGREFFDRLKKLIGEMHGRGITHGDIRRKNILVTPDHQPWLIDFAGAFCLRGKENPLRMAIFRRLKKVDDLTVLKIQSKLLPGTLTENEERLLSSVPWYLKLGRFFKKKIYRPFKHITRGKRRK